ncbi:fatty acid desaturase [Stella humosa]|uniref:Fatty acid desaturase n=1 Tax=Stella humosa TaxID=94 RepID=A0A3N1MDK1_9PROT|nr:fatty acid desaturase [Stella humosa]ROQ01811.1 fatty acid desaturase [Stella humosa]BBK32198.1 hydrocarbon oxygenase MocD [Stella humosa]
MDTAMSAGRVLAPQELKALSRRSNRHGILQFAIHLALIGLAAALVTAARGHWLVLPAMVLLGWVLVALFAPVHECVHYTAFRSRRLNDWVGWVAAVPSLVDFHFYKHFHYAHHRHCQDPALDPELMTPLPTTRWQYLLRVSAWNYWRARAAILWRVARGDFRDFSFVPERARATTRRSVVAMYVLVVAAIAGWAALDPWGPVLYWIGPVLLGQPILRAILLTEHMLCSDDGNALTNTRTTLVSWPVRLVHWNMPYHAEHHAYPSIPFHALPAAHRRMAPHLAHVERGYVRTHRAILGSLAGAR